MGIVGENNPRNFINDNAEKLFKTHYRSLSYFAYQLLQEKHTADDAVQEAFLALWDKKEILSDHPIAIKNFLYTHVKNICLNIQRRKKVINRYFETREEVDDEEDTVLEALINAEVLDELYQVVATLPENCQEIFRLGYLEGLKNAEIAEMLGISVNTVKTQKQRGLKILKKKLHPSVLNVLIFFLNF
ncbi:RNA polymerase sigma factor [Olivibacter sp. SDN3]|uniref:RNA polymerase sigma factor n=1 Tax=Olivibacter sp. SDN3 TaxID=2764720 RepID=UPI0021052D4E|nr:RNA polymerase sigma-70 factor [Olivibacter sp. SDN3]